MSIIFVGVAYFEPNENCGDGTCIAVYSNRIVKTYERLLQIVNVGMDEHYIGYAYLDNDKTLLDKIKNIIHKEDVSNKIKYNEICNLVNPIYDKQNDCMISEINQYFDDWKVVYA